MILIQDRPISIDKANLERPARILPGAALAASGRPARQRAIVLLIGSIVLVILVVRLFQTA